MPAIEIRTVIASPWTGLLYGSAHHYRDAAANFRAFHEPGALPEPARRTDWTMLADDEIPAWARNLTPGEYVESDPAPQLIRCPCTDCVRVGCAQLSDGGCSAHGHRGF